MKIIKSKFQLYFITIFILFFSSLTSTARNKSKRISSKNLLTFSSKKAQDINLKSFSLDKDSHLIARCPEKTALIKMIFEKREKSNRVDVGFNCRGEPEITVSNIFKSVVSFSNFDDLTPPNMECKDKSVFTGFEMRKIKDKVEFIWHCGSVKQLGSTALQRSDMFLDEQNKNNSNFDATKFSQFLTHTDIKVDDQQKQGIFFIKFNRKPNNNALDYQYGVIEIVSNDKTKK